MSDRGESEHEVRTAWGLLFGAAAHFSGYRLYWGSAHSDQPEDDHDRIASLVRDLSALPRHLRIVPITGILLLASCVLLLFSDSPARYSLAGARLVGVYFGNVTVAAVCLLPEPEWPTIVGAMRTKAACDFRSAA